MAGKKGNKEHANETSFTREMMLNNSSAEKYDFEQAKELFISIYEYAMNNDEVLCLQDAYFGTKVLHSTFYYLISKFPNLDKIKQDIQNDIVRRINKNALKGDFNPTASIWRMKQLGEHDVQNQNIDITSQKEKINIPIIKWSE